MKRRKIITLTTDFGEKDSYAAEMKGVILRHNPHVSFVDITHQVPPHDILHASLTLWRTYRYFPKGTLHLAVVDPGVGTERALLIVRSSDYLFLAPDNGLLGPIVEELKKVSLYQISPIGAGASVSHTFHGRDIVAPCAAKLSLGIPPQRLGKAVSSLKTLPLWKVSFRPSRLKGKILTEDRFGNLITNIRRRDYLRFKRGGKRKGVWIKAGKYLIKGLFKTYAEGGQGPLALFGSSGLLELALQKDSAAKALSLRRGDPVVLIDGR
ncbi:MAG: SAM-dependent chlorinase/fluorinase [Candidatus Omnitrophica bacterium]|nr:SAM-dependent chlorinase/fluorinase [Candidatus Omnitrophota bacterium]